MRKKWKVELWTGDQRLTMPRRSQQACYDWLREVADEPYETKRPPFDRAEVFVSSANGWDLFERLTWDDYKPR